MKINLDFDNVTVEVVNVIYEGKSILVSRPNKEMSLMDMENWRKLLKIALVNLGYDPKKLVVTTTYVNNWIMDEDFKKLKNEKKI